MNLEMDTPVQVVVGAAAVVAALGVIWHKAIKPFARGCVRALEAIEWVEGELKPNGGSSTRDAIDRMEIRQVELKHQQAKFDDRLTVVEDYITAPPRRSIR